MAKFIKIAVSNKLDSGTDAVGDDDKLTVVSTDAFSVGDIVHNTTDDTWATITEIDDETVVSLSADIMDAAEEYAVYSGTKTTKRLISADSMKLVTQTSVSTATIAYLSGSEGNDTVAITHEPLGSELSISLAVALENAIEAAHVNNRRPDLSLDVVLPAGISVVELAIA